MQICFSDEATLRGIEEEFRGRAVFVSAFPPCTDLSCAGAQHWPAKAKVCRDGFNPIDTYRVDTWCCRLDAHGYTLDTWDCRRTPTS